MRRVSNISIKERMKQVIILMILTLLGMFVSSLVNGQQFHKERKRHFKEKYSVQISNSKKECFILNKKRTELPRSSFFASNRRVKPKAMAEVDAPGTKR